MLLILYWRYSPKVYNTVLYLLNDADLAEDVVQELFLTIWEKRGNILPELNFEAYILTIARNLAYKYVEEALHRNLPVEEIRDAKLISKKMRLKPTPYENIFSMSSLLFRKCGGKYLS